MLIELSGQVHRISPAQCGENAINFDAQFKFFESHLTGTVRRELARSQLSPLAFEVFEGRPLW